MSAAPEHSEQPSRMPIGELVAGQHVCGCYACTEIEEATDRNGKTYLRLRLRDASGEVKAIHFDPSEHALTLSAGQIAVVVGQYSQHPQYGAQVQVRQLRIADDDEYRLDDLVPVSPFGAAELGERLHALIDSVTNADLRRLLERAFDGGREPGATFATAPAALRHHHAYRHGLLEHTVFVAEAASATAELFASVDRDLVIAGSLLHDIGKTQTYAADGLSSTMTDIGRLHGEIAIGQRIVQQLADEVGDFPNNLVLLLTHIVLAHHGMREKGSPVVPMTREAIIVHYCDDMTARVTAVDEAERGGGGDSWSARIPMIDTAACLLRPQASNSSDE